MIWYNWLLQLAAVQCTLHNVRAVPYVMCTTLFRLYQPNTQRTASYVLWLTLRLVCLHILNFRDNLQFGKYTVYSHSRNIKDKRSTAPPRPHSKCTTDCKQFSKQHLNFVSVVLSKNSGAQCNNRGTANCHQSAGNNAFEMTNAGVILTTNHRGEHVETLDIACLKWNLHFYITCSGSCLKPFDVLQSLTVDMALPEDGDNERRDVTECWSHSVTWCMADGAANVGHTAWLGVWQMVQRMLVCWRQDKP
jgi:hypothetical protein